MTYVDRLSDPLAFLVIAPATPDEESEVIRRAYATAIAEGYRFYSFGDATLIV